MQPLYRPNVCVLTLAANSNYLRGGSGIDSETCLSHHLNKVVTSALRSAWPKFEPTVSILYCSSIAVTCIMHNAVTLLNPKHAITRYGTANKRPVNARMHCVRAYVRLTLQKVPN